MPNKQIFKSFSTSLGCPIQLPLPTLDYTYDIIGKCLISLVPAVETKYKEV